MSRVMTKLRTRLWFLANMPNHKVYCLCFPIILAWPATGQGRLETLYKLRQTTREWKKGVSGFEWLTEREMRDERRWPELLDCSFLHVHNIYTHTTLVIRLKPEEQDYRSDRFHGEEAFVQKMFV